MKRIAINLDVICMSLRDNPDESEVKDCKLRHNFIPEKIKDLKEAGNYIIIYTTRRITLYMATKEWLRKEGIVYDEIQVHKPEFDILIDNNVEVQKMFPEGQKGR